MIKNIKGMFIIFLLCAFWGCGMMINGTTQMIPVTTNPPNATVKVLGDKDKTCTTPCTIELKRKNGYAMTIEKDNFLPATVPITKDMSPLAVLGDIWPWCFSGFLFDIPTGALYELSPKVVSINLIPSNSANEQEDNDKQKSDRDTQFKDTQSKAKEIKAKFESGEISEEEYNRLIKELIGMSNK